MSAVLSLYHLRIGQMGTRHVCNVLRQVPTDSATHNRHAHQEGEAIMPISQLDGLNYCVPSQLPVHVAVDMRKHVLG